MTVPTALCLKSVPSHPLEIDTTRRDNSRLLILLRASDTQHRKLQTKLAEFRPLESQLAARENKLASGAICN